MERRSRVNQRRRLWVINLAGLDKDSFMAPSHAYGTALEPYAIQLVRDYYPGCLIILPTSDRAPYDFRFQPVNPGPALYAEVKSHRERRGNRAETWWSVEEHTHAKKYGRLIIVCVPAGQSRRTLYGGPRGRNIRWYAYRFLHTDLPAWDDLLQL